MASSLTEGLEQDIDSESREFGRLNSYIRRTTTRSLTTANVEAWPGQERVTDFIDIISQISVLHQQNALPMEIFDNWTTEPLGSGAMFHVSSRKAVYKTTSRATRLEIKGSQTTVVIKKTPVLTHNEHGEPFDNWDSRDAANGLLRELRVLAFSVIRRHRNVVDLLGVAWSYEPCPNACPQLALILEHAKSTLDQHLFHYPNIAFSSRQSICRDIARGLLALHHCGIIHGDVKPENILMFETSDHDWIAKVADFSHSLFDTGEDRHLIGGTWPYAAPEWRQKAPTSLLMKTDIYSFGILVGCVISGYDVITSFLDTLGAGGSDERMLHLQQTKEEGGLQRYILGRVHSLDETDLEFTLEGLSMVEAWLESTLELDPKVRNLALFFEASSLGQSTDTVHDVSYPDSNMVDIPYQALQPMSNVLKKHVVLSLLRVAQSDSDTNINGRAAAACFELCICYASGFGVNVDRTKAIEWLTQAARLGEASAQSLCHRIYSALRQEVSSITGEVDSWLLQAASRGSWTALESLKELDSNNYKTALESFRRTTSPYDELAQASFKSLSTRFRRVLPPTDPAFYISSRNSMGQTFLHWAAIEGLHSIFNFLLSRSDILSGKFDAQDSNGDTALIYACRAGRAEIAQRLLEAGASARVLNHAGENVLHFLHTIDEKHMDSLASLLVQNGADCSQESKETRGQTSIFDMRVSVAGCPILRAVTMNNPYLVRILLALKNEHQPSCSPRDRMIWRSTCFKLLAWACRLGNSHILEVVCEILQETFQSTHVQSKSFWIRNRYLSLPALAIAGCVSDDPAYGFDFPERFWRYMYYGEHQAIQLRRTFEILRRFRVDLSSSECCGEHNALFFAIREGHTDAVSILLEAHDTSQPFESFGPTKPVPQRLLSEENIFLPRPGLPMHSLKVGLVNAVCLSILSGKHDIFQFLLETCDSEALKIGDFIPVYYIWPEKVPKMRGTTNVSKCFPLFRPIKQPKPRRSESKHSSTAKRVYINTEPYTPSDRKHRLESFFADGQLNYALLYMATIAASEHRDISFAHTLLEHDACELAIRHGWAPRNFLEQRCFEGFPQPLPLVIAAQKQWTALIALLFKNGARIDAFCYTESSNSYKFLTTELRSSIGGRLGTWRKPFVAPEVSRWILRSSVFEMLLSTPTERDDATRDLHHLATLLEVGTDKAFMPSSNGVNELWLLYDQLCMLRTTELISLERCIWNSVVKTYKQRSDPHPRADIRTGFVFRAAMDNRYTALSTFLDIGYLPNGKWWNRYWFTPLDVVTVIHGDRRAPTSEQETSLVANERRSCLHLLLAQPSIRRGLGFKAEIHFVLSFFFWIISMANLTFSICLPLYGVPFLVSYVRKFRTNDEMSQTETDKKDLDFFSGVFALFLLGAAVGFLVVAFIFLFIPLGVVIWILKSAISRAREKGLFKDSIILPILLPTLFPMAITVGDGSVILCAQNLRGPTAVFVRILLRLLSIHPWPNEPYQEDDIRILEFDDTADDIMDQQPRWKRGNWFSRITPQHMMARRQRRLRSGREVYADDQVDEEAVELLTQTLGRLSDQSRRDRYHDG